MVQTMTVKQHRKRPPIALFLTLTLGILLAVMGPQQVAVAAWGTMNFVESQWISYKIKDFNQIETQHFEIFYDGQDISVLALVQATAEEKYQLATERFQYEPAHKVRLILYDDPDTLMDVTLINKEVAPMGVYYGGSLHILNPREWVQEEGLMETYFKTQGPVLHELVHLFTDQLAAGHYPLWFTEGVSLYYEYAIDGYEWGKELELEEISPAKLEASFDEMDQYVAYTHAFRLVKAYVEARGEEALLSLIQQLGQGASVTAEMEFLNKP